MEAARAYNAIILREKLDSTHKLNAIVGGLPVVLLLLLEGFDQRIEPLVILAQRGDLASHVGERLRRVVARPVAWTLAPASCAALAGTVVFFAFFMAHREAVETIIQCFCEDTERNNGTPLRQYYAPAALKKLIFVDVQGHRPPSDRDADDAFEAEFRAQRRAKKADRREKKRGSRMGSVAEEE